MAYLMQQQGDEISGPTVLSCRVELIESSVRLRTGGRDEMRLER